MWVVSHSVDLLLEIKVRAVESILNSNHAQAVTEVFHEFLEVDALVPVDVSSQAQRDDLFLGEGDFGILQTLNVLVNLEESVLVAIVLLKQVK